MISDKSETKQVKSEICRMRGLNGYPKFPGDEKAEMELVISACRNADSLDTVRRTVDQIVSTWERCPFPSELASLCGANTPTRRRGCEDCDFTGWRIVTVNGVDGAKPCHCRGEA